jgi:mannose-6-phosphate isomerase-like protein (cupin superfamily)
VTGEILIFHRTSSETEGDAVLVETIVRPGGFVAATHVHPYQTERFEVLEGRLGLRVGDRELLAGPGEVAVVEPGTPHRFWNAGEGEARFMCEVRPALEFESLIETMFTLALEGKTNRRTRADWWLIAPSGQGSLDRSRCSSAEISPSVGAKSGAFARGSQAAGFGPGWVTPRS